MRTGTVSYKLEDLRKGVIIPIGMVGENDFTRVIFDAEEVFKKHPDAQVTMKVQPPKGGIYPATVTRDGNTVTWQVKAADVAHRGSGELQLTFTADTMVEKSYIARTDIKRSLVGNGPAPDPVQDWVDNAEEVLEDLEAAEVHQPIIGLDGYWYTWNQGTGEYEKTNTKAQGQDGHSPVLTSSKSGKTTTIFADGDQLAQIMDGEDGQGADVIDDTAGEGDTDKTWSANKLDTEITDVKTAIDGIEENYLQNTGIRITSGNKSQYFTDFDNAPNNSVYGISASAELAHSPYGYGMSSAAGVYDGTVRSILGYPDGTLYTFVVGVTKQQIFVSNRNGSGGTQGSTQIIFFRVKQGESYQWTDWTMASNVISPSSTNFAIRKKFIARYIDGQGNPTATDTGILNPQYISDPFVFKDFNDAPNNSIYHIDLDCDASVMANHPNPGHSCVLITSNFAYKNKHAQLQLCAGLDGVAGSDAFLYWRYTYQLSSDVFQYTPWERVNSAKGVFKGLAEAAADPANIYTATEKTAIKNLIGANEQQWVLIREDSFTNATEADINITVDDNGNTFQLTDVIVLVTVPTQTGLFKTATSGAIQFINGNSIVRAAYLNGLNITDNETIRVGIAIVRQNCGMIEVLSQTYANRGVREPLKVSTITEEDNTAIPFSLLSTYFDKITIKNITGKISIRVLGKRKMN